MYRASCLFYSLLANAQKPVPQSTILEKCLMKEAGRCWVKTVDIDKMDEVDERTIKQVDRQVDKRR